MAALADTTPNGRRMVVETSVAETRSSRAASTPPSRPAPLPKALTPERLILQVTIDAETDEDLMRVRAHLQHAIPDGDVAKIIERAVSELRTATKQRDASRPIEC